MYTGDKSEGPSQSTDNFTAILEAAKKEYKKLTRKDLDTHRFSVQLKNCKSPEAFLDVLQEQVHAFSKSSGFNERLMHSLRPIVHILFTFSETIVQGAGIVSHLIRPARPFSDIWLPDTPTCEHDRHRYLCSSSGASMI